MKFYLVYLAGLFSLGSCTSSKHTATQYNIVESEINFLSPSFSFHLIDGNSNVFGRIAERGLRDTFHLLLQEAVVKYFPTASISSRQKSTCLDYSIHRGNWRDSKWKEYATYVCLKPPPDTFNIHLSVMFEVYEGSTVGISNPNNNSWIGVHIYGFKNNTIILSKYIYDAIEITRRQEKMMIQSRNYYPYFPKEQIIRLLERVFVYLQKELK